jgi:predicted nucleic acid-binding protein
VIALDKEAEILLVDDAAADSCAYALGFFRFNGQIGIPV